MKANLFISALIASAVFASPVLAQDTANKASDNKAVETTQSASHKRGPIDEAKFTNIDALKAADTDKDGFLSRAELEAYALQKMVKRSADRMERRLDINNDGKISLDAIQKNRAEKFAKLDTNKDGQLDRSEFKAAKHDKQGKRDGKHGGKRHQMKHNHHDDQKKSEQPKAN